MNRVLGNCLKIRYTTAGSDGILCAHTNLLETCHEGKGVPARWKIAILPGHPFWFMPYGQQEFFCEARADSSLLSKFSLFHNFSELSLKKRFSYYSSSNKVVSL